MTNIATMDEPPRFSQHFRRKLSGHDPHNTKLDKKPTGALKFIFI